MALQLSYWKITISARNNRDEECFTTILPLMLYLSGHLCYCRSDTAAERSPYENLSGIAQAGSLQADKSMECSCAENLQ